MDDPKYLYILDCPCGHTMEEPTEDAIVETAFAHLREQHPQMADEYERHHILFMARRMRV